MSSERLESCEENLRTVLEDVRKAIKHQDSWKAAGGGMRKQPINLLDKLKEGESLLYELHIEVENAPPAYQKVLSYKVARYESELASLRREMEGASSTVLRVELFRQPMLEDDPYESHEDEERTQLLKNTDTLKRTSASIYRAKQVSAQSDEMAVDIMDELCDQKSTLIKTRNRLTDIDHETERSRVLISTIACKTVQNRIILILIIIMEIIALFGVLFFKLFRKFHN